MRETQKYVPVIILSDSKSPLIYLIFQLLKNNIYVSHMRTSKQFVES